MSESLIIDWRVFFEIDDDEKPEFANRISPLVPVFHLPGELEETHRSEGESCQKLIDVDLFERTILRGMSLNLPTGQEAVAYLKGQCGHPEVADDIGLDEVKINLIADVSPTNSLKEKTPLWLYIMLEANGYGADRLDNPRLGKLGGWLVADTLATAAQSLRLPEFEEWNPADSVIYQDCPGLLFRRGRPEHISFRDLVKFTYPDDFELPDCRYH